MQFDEGELLPVVELTGIWASLAQFRPRNEVANCFSLFGCPFDNGRPDRAAWAKARALSRSANCRSTPLLR